VSSVIGRNYCQLSSCKLHIFSWFTLLWKFLHKLQLKLHITQAWLPPIPNGNDINLMDYSLSRGHTPNQLQSLNRCRVYLQALSLSDLVSADGNCIMPSVFTGQRLVDRCSTLAWPIRIRSPKSDWLIWASSLNTLCIGHSLISPIDMSQIESHQSWFWYMDQYSNLYRTVNGTWVHYHPVGSHEQALCYARTRYHQSDSAPCHSPPTLLSVASAEHSYGGIIQATKCCNPTCSTPASPISRPSFKEVALSHPLYSFLLAHVRG